MLLPYTYHNELTEIHKEGFTMPLILGLQKGHDFYVGSSMTKVVLTHIESDKEFTLESEGTTYTVTDDCAQEILPDVRISCGSRGSSMIARVIIDAPQNIRIFRGNVVRPKRKPLNDNVQIYHRGKETSQGVNAFNSNT